MAMRFNRSFNVQRVVKRLVRSILALYVGGTIISTFGTVMNLTASPLYSGLSLIGWTLSETYNATTASCATTATLEAGETAVIQNCITSTSGTGVLAVIGIIAIAQIVTEFITW